MSYSGTVHKLTDLIPAEYMPDMLAEAADVISSKVGYTDVAYSLAGGAFTLDITVAIEGELAISIPGIDVVQLVFGPGVAGWTSVPVRATLAPAPSLELELDVALRISDDLLHPAKWETADDGSREIVRDETAGPLEIILGSLSVELGPDGNVELGVDATVDVPLCLIGDSGIAFEATGARFFGSTYSVATGQANGSRGFYLESATLYLPSTLAGAVAISATDCFIGNGGFSGTLLLSPTETGEGLTTSLFGCSFTLWSASVTFVQNAVTASAIAGSLTIPWFDGVLDVTLTVGSDGAFGLVVSDDDSGGIASITQAGLGTLTLSKLGVETGGGTTSLILGGSLLLTAGSPTIQWPEVVIDELRIDSEGNVTIAGGWLNLQQPISVDLYGFALEITQIGFGNNDDGSKWIGFSGGIRLTEILPTGASVDGMRLTFEKDWTFRGVTLEGVGVQLTIPDVLELSGNVSLVDAGNIQYFSGNAHLALKTVQLTADASIIVGRDNERDYTFLYIFVSVDLPVGIPIAATGAGIFGFAGLFGMNVAPGATETDNDWYAWYKKAYNSAPAYNITHAGKWVPAEGDLAFGAGLSIGTLADTGWVVNAKGLIVVLIPGPVVMLNAKANILEVKPELEDTSEGTFDLLAVLDAREGYIQLNIDAGWDIGKVLSIDASTEAYFDFVQPSLWHVYMGEKDPEEKRIRADVMSLFHADSYLMIDSTGLATGFAVTFGDSWEFGPITATLTAWIEATADITWKPVQAEGSLGLGGEFAVGVAGFEIGISVEALLEGKAPSLYWVHGVLSLTVNLPKPLKDIHESPELEWREPKEPDLTDPLQSISLSHSKVLETWTTDESGKLLLTSTSRSPSECSTSPYVPLDARPAVTFARPVNIGELVEVSNPATSNDLKDTIGDYKIRYDVTAISLERASKAWGTSAAWESVDGTLKGSWTAEDGGEGTDESLSYRKLQLFELNPFAFASRASRVYADRFLEIHPSWPCGSTAIAPTVCVDWDDVVVGTAYTAAFRAGEVVFATGVTVTVEACKTPLCSQTQALHQATKDDHSGSLWIAFPEPVRTASLCIETGTSDIRVRAFRDGNLLREAVIRAGTRTDLVLDAPATEWVEVSGLGWWLARVCYTTEAAAAAANWQETRGEIMESALSSWEGEGYVFDAESYYRLTVETRATLYEGSTEVGDQPFGPSYAYFQTGGPPALAPCGLAEPAPQTEAGTDTEPYPFGGGLADLTAYVRWTFPENGAKAAYGSYDLGVEFNETYVEQMYGGDLADMSIRLLDANGQAATDADGNQITFDNAWGTAPAAELSTLETAYVTRVTDCTTASVTVFAVAQTVTASASGTETQLSPETLYSAQLTGTYVLFQDNEATWTSGWPSASSAWDFTVANAAIVGLESWDDYRVEVSLSSTGGTVGVVVRQTGLGAHYRLELVPSEGARLVRHYFGRDSVLWSDAARAPDTTEPATYALSLECTGNTLTAELDGVTLWTEDEWTGWAGTDRMMRTALSAGRAGLYRDGDGSFSDFIIRTAPRETTYGWSFATSAFAGFAEHMDSFTGNLWEIDATATATEDPALATVWSGLVATAATAMLQVETDLTAARATLSAASATAVESARTDAQAASTARDASAAEQYEILYAALLGGTYRALPGVVEVNEVVAGGSRYALLLESPEPIDWSRVTISLRRLDADAYVDVTGAITLWSADGTRAFIVCNIGTALIDDAGYQLHLEYALDLGAEAPVLSRAGNSTPEIADLTFDARS